MGTLTRQEAPAGSRQSCGRPFLPRQIWHGFVNLFSEDLEPNTRLPPRKPQADTSSPITALGTPGLASSELLHKLPLQKHAHSWGVRMHRGVSSWRMVVEP